MGLAFFVLSLLIALGGIFSSLFEQAERRADEERRARRK
jgi:Na+-transporting methylmalonyl-CoA/oxaloacetate decarboxylase gamma subunit